MLNDSATERIIRQSLAEPVSVILAGTAAATAANYSDMFVAKEPCRITQVTAVWRTAASGAGTLDVQKRGSGVAVGSATSILSAVLPLNTAANTPVNASLNQNANVLKAGDTLNLVGATLTALADAVITIWIEPLIPEFRN
jgi:hypothetical protein